MCFFSPRRQSINREQFVHLCIHNMPFPVWLGELCYNIFIVSPFLPARSSMYLSIELSFSSPSSLAQTFLKNSKEIILMRNFCLRKPVVSIQKYFLARCYSVVCRDDDGGKETIWEYCSTLYDVASVYLSNPISQSPPQTSVFLSFRARQNKIPSSKALSRQHIREFMSAKCSHTALQNWANFTLASHVYDEKKKRKTKGKRFSFARRHRGNKEKLSQRDRGNGGNAISTWHKHQLHFVMFALMLSFLSLMFV